MATISSATIVPNPPQEDSIKARLCRVSDDLLGSFPVTEKLSPAERRGIIGRYSSVLEGNFIYWMTGALIAASTEEARLTIKDNLFEEVRDSHPAMLRKFAMAAHAVPT